MRIMTKFTTSTYNAKEQQSNKHCTNKVHSPMCSLGGNDQHNATESIGGNGIGSTRLNMNCSNNANTVVDECNVIMKRLRDRRKYRGESRRDRAADSGMPGSILTSSFPIHQHCTIITRLPNQIVRTVAL